MAGVNWVEFGGIAQGVAAAATLLLAGGTYWLARKANQEVEAANKEAEAANKEAEATRDLAEEARRDRELTWRPHLTVTQRSDHRMEGDGNWSFPVGVRNVGSGPALECKVFQLHRNSWSEAAPFDLAPRDAHDFEIEGGPPSSGKPLPLGIFDLPSGARPGTLRVATCKDVLGNMYRFVDGYAPEKIGPGAPNQAMTWAKCYLRLDTALTAETDVH